MRNIAQRLGILAVLTLIGVGSAGRLSAALEPPEIGLSAEIWFVDQEGDRLVDPLANIAGAVPGFTTSLPIAIYNGGHASVDYELEVVAPSSDRPRLVDVLIATVRSANGGPVSYSGSLGALQLSGQAVAAGEAVRYSVTVSWPDGGADDNQFQGRSETFSMQARAWSAR